MIEEMSGMCYRHRCHFVPTESFGNKCPACYWETKATREESTIASKGFASDWGVTDTAFQQSVHLTASGAGGRGDNPLQADLFADDPSATNGGR